MAQYSDNGVRPASRHYRLLMEKAIAAKNLGQLDTYNMLVREADVLLKHIRESSSLQVEGQDAQYPVEPGSQFQ